MASLTTLGFQVAALFAIVYAWFHDGVPGVWKQISRSQEAEQLLSRLQVKAPAAGGGGTFQNLKEFATVAAVTHTAVLLLGFGLSAVAARVASGIAGPNPRQSLAALLFRRTATRWVSFGVCVAISFVALHAFFRWSFENRVGITYRMAAQFFYERDGSTPFALMSTTSYIMFFAAGFAVKQLFPADDSVDGIFPSVLMRWMPRLVKAFLVAMLIFHFAVMPIYDNVVKPVIKLDEQTSGDPDSATVGAMAAAEGEDFTHHFALLASLSHTVALALGLLLCWLARLSVQHLNSVQQSRRRVMSYLKGAMSAIAVLAACFGLALSVQWYTNVSADTILVMVRVLKDWCRMKLMTSLDVHTVFSSKLATFLGMDSSSAAHPLVFLSLAIWFSIGLATEYCNSMPTVERDPDAESTATRPVFQLGPVKVFPITKGAADAVGWLLPLGFTLAGLAHEHTALFYDCLIRAFIGLLATVMPLAMLVQAFCMRFGRKIQVEKNAPPLYWEEGCDTVSTIYMVACFMAWPLTQHRAGHATALHWTLGDTGDSFWYYFVVKLIGGIVLADCWNYWKHRALHWRMLYVFHKPHHSYYDPSCFASFAIHPFEALLTFWQIMLFTIPALNLWGPLHVGVLIVLGIMNLYLHCGYKIGLLERGLPLVLLNTSAFHNVHHEVTRAHFGEILFLWDWLCGTAIDRRLDDHPVIAGMFENAPYSAERRELRRRMDIRRGVLLADAGATMAVAAKEEKKPMSRQQSVVAGKKVKAS